MKCKSCGAEILEGKKFCAECGAKVEVEKKKKEVLSKCPECGAKLAKNATFCGDCGAKTSEEENGDKKVFCSECGAKIKNGESFCSECGAKVLNSKVDKVPMNPKKKRTYILIIVLLGVIIAGYFIIGGMFKPESVAKSFCDGLKNNNSSKIFNILDLPDSDYLSQDKFKTVMESEDNKIKSCTVSEFDTNEDVVVFKLTVTNDEDEEDTLSLELKKSKEKNLLLFDKWVIDSEGMIRSDWQISVPEGAKLFIDGKEITSKDEDSYTNGYDAYTIKNTFSGAKYEIKATHDLYKEYKESLEPTYSTKVEMEVKGEFSSEVEKFIEELYNVALLDKETTDFEKLVTEEYFLDAKELVSNVKSTILYASCVFGECGYQNIEISDVTISNKETALKDEIKFKVNFSIAYEYKDPEYEEYTEKTSKYYLNLQIKSTSENGWLISGKN